jgi:chorismate synthase
MTANTFGQLFRFTTWGESHGPAIGCVVDGVPSRLPLAEPDIQHWLDRRRPGQSKYTTQRKEPDAVRILSGVFEGQTTGAPVSLMIENVDARSKDYGDIKDKFRPGHADYTYWAKYGIRDYRGGGRSSARETACRVAAGAIARRLLERDLPDLAIRGALVQMGPHRVDPEKWDWAETGNNPFWCPDKNMAAQWADYLDGVRKANSSAAAMVTINAVKGVEIGDGFAAAETPGEQAHDEMRRSDDGGVRFLSNHAGGVLGGISSGQEVVVRFVVKPTSSLPRTSGTVDVDGNDVEIVTTGRHDPGVGIRAVPVGEAMMACVLADHWLRRRTEIG